LNTVHEQLRAMRRQLESLQAQFGTAKREPTAKRKAAPKESKVTVKPSRAKRKVSR
jgi:hypothetical protein